MLVQAEMVWQRSSGSTYGPGQDRADLRGFQAGAERIGRVGAGIDDRLALDAQQLAGVVGPRGDDVVMLAAVGAGAQLLEAVLEPAHRPAELPRQAGADDLLGQQDALVAEAAADVGRDDAHLALVEAEAVGEAGLGDVRHLGRGRDDHLLEPRIPFGQHAPALERRHALARGAQVCA